MTTQMTIAVVTFNVGESPTLISACGFDRNDETGALKYINDELKAWIKTNKEIAANYHATGGSFELDDDQDRIFTHLKTDHIFMSANSGESVILFAVDAATQQSWEETEG